MQLSKNQIIPIAVVVFAVVIAIYFRPLLVIDETRYFGVAWEMFVDKNFFVPHLNGNPYDHKPPLLFWLINLDWHLFGVNETQVRFIPLLFAIGSMVLVWRIYKMLWSNDSFGAAAILWVFAGMLLFSFYSTLFMFDIMLGFWVLLAIYGGLRALKAPTLKNFAIIAFAIGFGILAKSPVVVAHLLPIYLLAHTFAKPTKRFYIGGLLAVVAGIGIALLWAIPAALIGGEEYSKGIFWGQYAGRAVDSFAHSRPFWWYLYWIPLIFFPWILFKPFWSGIKELIDTKKLDSGLRFLAVWLLGALLIFSLISGKQLHYLVPEFGGFAILITRAISITKETKLNAKVLGGVFFLLGLSLIIAPFFIKGFLVVYLDKVAFVISGVLFTLYGAYLLFKRFSNRLKLVSLVAFSSLLIIFVIHFILHIYLDTQNLTKISYSIAKLQKSGKVVAHYGKYNDQYHFLGRLKEPLKVLKSAKALHEYIKLHPNDGLIIYLKRDIPYNESVVIDRGKLRTQNILLIWAKDYNRIKNYSK